MRAIFLIFVISFSIMSALKAQAVQYVRSNSTKRQLQSMVITKWDKSYFRPQWYYLLWHRKYKNGEDRRTIKQLLPTMAAVRASKNKSEDQKEDTETLFDQEVAKASNILLESHYHLHFKPVFDKLNADINSLIDEATNVNVDNSVIQTLLFEQERLNNEVEIIREGYIEKGDSAEGMSEIEKDLRTLKAQIIRLVELYKIKNKYQK